MKMHEQKKPPNAIARVLALAARRHRARLAEATQTKTPTIARELDGTNAMDGANRPALLEAKPNEKSNSEQIF